jgi:hypothetical protein
MFRDAFPLFLCPLCFATLFPFSLFRCFATLYPFVFVHYVPPPTPPPSRSPSESGRWE